jgi:hypothetical protein
MRGRGKNEPGASWDPGIDLEALDGGVDQSIQMAHELDDFVSEYKIA